jgi:hypothetical protein
MTGGAIPLSFFANRCPLCLAVDTSLLLGMFRQDYCDQNSCVASKCRSGTWQDRTMKAKMHEAPSGNAFTMAPSDACRHARRGHWPAGRCADAPSAPCCTCPGVHGTENPMGPHRPHGPTARHMPRDCGVPRTHPGHGPNGETQEPHDRRVHRLPDGFTPNRASSLKHVGPLRESACVQADAVPASAVSSQGEGQRHLELARMAPPARPCHESSTTGGRSWDACSRST